MKKIFYSLLFILFFVDAFSQKPSNKRNTEKQQIDQKYNNLIRKMRAPISENWALSMLDSFSKRSLNELNNHSPTYIKEIYFDFDLTIFYNIIDSMNGDSSVMKVFLVKFDSNKIDENISNLTYYKNLHGKLFFVFGTCDKKEDNPSKYYIPTADGKKSEIKKDSFLYMQKGYIDEILPKIKRFSHKKDTNTIYIKYFKKELLTYKFLIENSLETVSKIRLLLAEEIDPTKLNNPPIILKPNYKNNLSVGQLTFITSAINPKGYRVGSIPFYNYNDMCPAICP